jgi:hypothetical protein
VQTEARVGPRVECTIPDHSYRTIHALLRGLEDETDRARHVSSACRKDIGDRQQNRRVAIVAAGVVGAVNCRAVWLSSIHLCQRECVHIGAQHHPPTRPPTGKRADDACLTDASAHAVQSEGGQARGHDASGAVLPVRQLGVTMQVTP